MSSFGIFGKSAIKLSKSLMNFVLNLRGGLSSTIFCCALFKFNLKSKELTMVQIYQHLKKEVKRTDLLE